MAMPRDELKEQVEQYTKLHPNYKTYARVLQNVLSMAVKHVCPVAIVQSRAKAIPSFANKCVKNYPAIKDAVSELTDLCGARTIVQLRSQVDEMADFVRQHFIIDVANSQDTSERLGVHEFGYRSVHFIVTVDPDRLPPGAITQAEYEQIADLKAEIQLRTVAEHAWSDFGHDNFYKSEFQVPANFERESAKIAAALETVDSSFMQLAGQMKDLQTNVGAYKGKPQTEEEIDRLQAIIEYDDKNPALAARLARKLSSIGRYDEAVELIEKFTGPQTSDLAACLGHATCQLHRSDLRSEDYRHGQEILERVISEDENHLEALTLLGEPGLVKITGRH